METRIPRPRRCLQALLASPHHLDGVARIAQTWQAGDKGLQRLQPLGFPEPLRRSYRVTPLFHGDELVARGVQMEARSIEDEGAGVSFNVYCHNVQPGVSIDYATGKSCRASRSKEPARPPQGYILANGSRLGEGRDDANSPPAPAYTLNFSSRRYHLMTCRSITDIGTRNKGACRLGRDELIALGYRPCGCCKP